MAYTSNPKERPPIRITIKQSCNGDGGVTWMKGAVVDASFELAHELIERNWATEAPGAALSKDPSSHTP